jgi:methanogenic corrinoid protein MtbC1
LREKVDFEQKDAAAHLEACLQAIENFDTFALQKALMQASVALSLPDLIDKVVAPLMEKVGEFWQSGAFRVAHEHAVSGVVRTFLGNLRFSKPAAEYAPTAIVATPAGQLHEIGALMAAVTAASEGWQVIYLGPNLPAQEIALAATKKDAKAVLLSLVYPQDDPFLGDELARLHSLLKAGTAVIVGGRAARAYAQPLQANQAIIVEDLQSLRRELQAVRKNA